MMKGRNLTLLVLTIFLSNWAYADSIVQRLCNIQNITGTMEVLANPDGYYIPDLQIQLSHGDSRIINAVGSVFRLCVEESDFHQVGERAVLKYLFVPVDGCKKKADRVQLTES